MSDSAGLGEPPSPSLADRIWVRDQGITTRWEHVNLSDPEWAASQATVDATSLALRLTHAPESLAVLAPLDATAKLPTTCRIILDGPMHDDTSHHLIAWFRANGFRTFGICEEHDRWTSVDPALSRCGSGDAWNALYAVRGADVSAISVFLHSSALGGAEQSLREWAEGLTADGHLIHCYLPDTAGPLAGLLEQAGTSVSTHGTTWWVTAGDERPWSDAAVGIENSILDLARHRPDAVLTQTVVVPSGALAARALGIPHIWWVHERPDPEYGLHSPTSRWADLGEVMWRLSDQVAATSQFVAEAYWPNREVAVVAPIRLSPLDGLQSSRGAGGVSTLEGTPTIGVIGTISHAKGQHLVVEALSLLRGRGMDVRVRFSGSGSHEAVQELAERADELGVADLVEGLGKWLPRSEAFDGLAAVVVPSWAEGFGRVPLEAVAAGIPVVYSRSGGLAEYLHDGVNGVSFEPRDSSSLADGITRVLTDPGLRERLTESALPDLHQRLAPLDSRTRLPELVRAAVGEASRESDWVDVAIPRLVAASADAIVTRQRNADDLIRGLQGDLESVRGELHERTLQHSQASASLDAVLNSRAWRAKTRLCRLLRPLGLCKE